jgi:hypothetical protein
MNPAGARDVLEAGGIKDMKTSVRRQAVRQLDGSRAGARLFATSATLRRNARRTLPRDTPLATPLPAAPSGGSI